MNNSRIRSLSINALLVALMCASAVSLPIGTLKVSLQLLFIFLIGLLSTDLLSAFVPTFAYMLMALFLPVSAGYVNGIANPTFGFVVGFVPGAVVLYLIKKLYVGSNSLKFKIAGIVLALLACLLIVYACGAVYMYIYFAQSGNVKEFAWVLNVCVWPYIPFDIAKMVISSLIYLQLEKILKLNK